MKKGWIIAAALVLSALLIAGGFLFVRTRELRHAAELFRAGDYAAARELYLKIGETENAARCEESLREARYHEARRLMGSGSYREAIEIFEALGDYQASRKLLPECRFLYAGALCGEGELDEAKEIYLSLGDYPGCEEALAELPVLYYDKALSLARAFDLEGACRIWEELGDFRNCDTLRQRGERILAQLWDPYRTRLNDPSRSFQNSMNAEVYVCDEAYIVAPTERNSETRFFLYYPGGRDEELNTEFFYTYLIHPAPNTLAVFLRKNGLPDMHGKNLAALDLLEKAATDFGVFVDTPVVAGSSLGVYPALQCPLYAWHGYGIQVSCVLSLDAGNDWWEPLLVPDEETARELSRIGTELYLLQSPDTSTDLPAIQTFVNAGNRVTVIECLNDQHEQISYDAFGLGLVNWALGDRSEDFVSENYRFRPLS